MNILFFPHEFLSLSLHPFLLRFLQKLELMFCFYNFFFEQLGSLYTLLFLPLASLDAMIDSCPSSHLCSFLLKPQLKKVRRKVEEGGSWSKGLAEFEKNLQWPSGCLGSSSSYSSYTPRPPFFRHMAKPLFHSTNFSVDFQASDIHCLLKLFHIYFFS